MSKNRELIRSAALGMAFGGAIMLAMCFAVSGIGLLIDLTDGVLDFFGMLIPGVSCFAAAYFSTQKCRTRGLVQGLTCGLATYLCILFFSIVTGNFGLSDMIFIKAAVCILSGAFGGIKGINTRKTKLR